MFVITMYFEGLKIDWFCQLGHPRKIKNLLTYLLTYLSAFGIFDVRTSNIVLQLRPDVVTFNDYRQHLSNMRDAWKTAISLTHISEIKLPSFC